MPTGLGADECCKQPVAYIMVGALSSRLPVAGPALLCLWWQHFCPQPALLQAGLYPTQLLFHAAQERMTAQKPYCKQMVTLAENEVHLCPPGHYRMSPTQMKKLESGRRVGFPGWAASFSIAHQVGLGLGQMFVNPLH